MSFLLWILGFTFPMYIQAQSIRYQAGLSEYEKGYKLEKEYPIFSIPHYEDALTKSQDPKMKKITATRLYYLYKKFKKYADLLAHYSKYRNLLAIGKEHEETVKEICEYFKIQTSEFYQVYPILNNIQPEDTGQLLEILTNKPNHNLFMFVYTYLLQRKNYDELKILLFYLPETIATPTLKYGLVVKLNQENSESLAKKILSNEEITSKEASDIYYLLGIYFMQNGNPVQSEKSFLESAKYGDKKRTQRELAKLYTTQGRLQEACSVSNFSLNSLNESEVLLHILCNPNQKQPSELKEAVQLLAKQENHPFYWSVLEFL